MKEILNQIAEYLFLKKKDPNKPVTPWTKYMHGMNRISIIIFLLALVVMVIRIYIKK